MYKPLISVLVTVYNEEKYVKKCIESIIMQTYANIQIILVDDGSTDNSGKFCDEYAKRDCRIQVIHKENEGVVSARKEGAAIAEGEYIISIDGDDWIGENRILKLVEAIGNEKIDMIYMDGFYLEYPEKSILRNYKVEEKFFDKNDIIDEVFNDVIDEKYAMNQRLFCSPCMWAIDSNMYKKNSTLIDKELTIAEDQVIIWYCLLDSTSIKYIHNNEYHYVQREDSATHNLYDINYQKIMWKKWYLQMRQLIEKNICSKKFYEKIILLIARLIMVYSYDLFQNLYDDYLYPYSTVKKGSQIVLYGLGKIGYQILESIADSKDYDIVYVVDKEKKGTILNHEIKSIDVINAEAFDYIVISIVEWDIAIQIKEDLLKRNIPENKIAMIDPNVINEDVIFKVLDIQEKEL